MADAVARPDTRDSARRAAGDALLRRISARGEVAAAVRGTLRCHSLSWTSGLGDDLADSGGALSRRRLSERAATPPVIRTASGAQGYDGHDDALLRGPETVSDIRSGRRHRTITLIGPGAAGKSTIGKALAERLDVPFADLDIRFSSEHGDIGDYIRRRGYQA